MLEIIELIKPLPRKLLLVRDDNNIGKFFDYKSYVSIKKICSSIIKNNNNLLYDALSIFSMNHYKYRNILYKNLEYLDIEQLDKNADLNGVHTLDENGNFIAYRNDNSFYHEFLHMSSSVYDETNEVSYSGLSYADEKVKLGEGINEGYTQLLTDRETNNNNMYYMNEFDENNDKMPIYAYVNALASQLEIIIGKEKLEEIYFNANFYGLVEELMKYKSEKEIIKFFKNCDAASLADRYKNIYLNRKALEAQEFLKDIVIKNMPEKLDEFKENRLVKENYFGFGKLIPIKLYNEEIRMVKGNSR